jgi:hypothetical protein
MPIQCLYIIGYIRTTELCFNVIGYDVSNALSPVLLPTPWPPGHLEHPVLFDQEHTLKSSAIDAAHNAVDQINKWGWPVMYVGNLLTYFRAAFPTQDDPVTKKLIHTLKAS